MTGKQFKEVITSKLSEISESIIKKYQAEFDNLPPDKNYFENLYGKLMDISLRLQEELQTKINHSDIKNVLSNNSEIEILYLQASIGYFICDNFLSFQEKNKKIIDSL